MCVCVCVCVCIVVIGCMFTSNVFKVRAAAVFALGTYMLNSSEDGHSDLATSIDHIVGMRLLTLLNDGSPIVRQVCVCICLCICTRYTMSNSVYVHVGSLCIHLHTHPSYFRNWCVLYMLW